MKNEARCEAIVGEFVWGVTRCGEPAYLSAIDPTWGTEHSVCERHAPTDSSTKEG